METIGQAGGVGMEGDARRCEGPRAQEETSVSAGRWDGVGGCRGRVLGLEDGRSVLCDPEEGVWARSREPGAGEQPWKLSPGQAAQSWPTVSLLGPCR